MQMLQWWTEGPTTEALFCRGGGRLALCVCATHRHTTVITLTIQSGWWRRWGVGERGKGFLPLMKMAAVKPRQGNLMPVIHGPFGPVFPVNVLDSGGLIMLLRRRASSTRGCSLIMAHVWMYWPSCYNCSSIYHRNCRKKCFWSDLVSDRSRFKGNIAAVSDLNQALTGCSCVTRDTLCPSASG